MRVSKYSASGNDFVIFHTFNEVNRSELARKLCDRHEGIGADGLIVLLPYDKYDFKWQFYNSDGSEASMCGNGTRACAHYAFTNSLAPKDMAFLTNAGVIKSFVDGNVVESQLTKPKKLQDKFEENGKIWHFYDTGVPHLVTYVDDLNTQWNLEIIKSMREKYNANVNFVKLDEIIKIRTFERGVEDETKACGTGMVASFLAAFKENKLNSSCKIMPKSKEILEVRIDGEDLYFKGEVRHVFDGILDFF